MGIGIRSSLGEMDWRWPDRRRLRASGLDLPFSRNQFDGHSRHAPNAHPGSTWSLPLDPASVLRLGCAPDDSDFPDGGELVSSSDWCDRVRTARPQNADRRRQSGGSLWGQLPAVHDTNGPFFPSHWRERTARLGARSVGRAHDFFTVSSRLPLDRLARLVPMKSRSSIHNFRRMVIPLTCIWLAACGSNPPAPRAQPG